MNKTLKLVSNFVYYIAFLLIFALFTILSIKIKPFNYGRANLWQALTMIYVFCVFQISFVFEIFEYSALAYLLLFSILGLAFIIFGVIYQWNFLPNLLYRSKDADIA